MCGREDGSAEAFAQEHTFGVVEDGSVRVVQQTTRLLEVVRQAGSHFAHLFDECLLRLLAKTYAVDEVRFIERDHAAFATESLVRELHGEFLFDFVNLNLLSHLDELATVTFHSRSNHLDLYILDFEFRTRKLPDQLQTKKVSSGSKGDKLTSRSFFFMGFFGQASMKALKRSSSTGLRL